jgi:P-aminobenzoate N-oxygenase AurF
VRLLDFTLTVAFYPAAEIKCGLANMTLTLATSPARDDRFDASLQKLTASSIENHYNVYRRFQWPDSLPADSLWMSPELLSVYGTPVMEQLDDAALKRLTKWESINFYSLNVHGIRDLLIEVTRRIHMAGYEAPSEFFHRFIGEENDHMWFFAQFCLKYGPKIYPDRSLRFEGTSDRLAEDFLVFARIVIFEELVDYYNMTMARDQRLHPLIQEINRVHHQDESRHISAGRQMVRRLHAQLKKSASRELLAKLDEYVKRYIIMSIESLYNPRVYADAGLPEPYQLRCELLQHPARKQYHRKAFKRIVGYLTNNRIISEGEFI